MVTASSSSSAARGNWKEIGRVVNGLSLVAKEFAKRCVEGEENIIRSTAKKALDSATDLAGLTKGSPVTIRTDHPSPTTHGHKFGDQLESPHKPDSSSSSPSRVVYFHSHHEHGNEDQQEQHNLMQLHLYDTSTTPCSSSSLSVAAPHPPTALHDSNIDVPHAVPTFSPSMEDPITTATSPAPTPNPIPRRKPRERRVPSTPFSRALGFAGLGAGLAWGTLQESAKRLVFGNNPSSSSSSSLSPFLSDQNAERLALALCRMRGAALKIGQMLSIQDESLVPPPILAALEIVRQGADVMPKNQLNQVLDTELGTDWSTKLTSFDYEPLAAASIGQVHRAVTRDGLQVAMKIQYPGVANSIDSDIENVKLLLNYTNLIPKGLYLDRAIKVAKEELSRECDYLLEAKNQKHFRELLSGTEGFYVPAVVDDLSSKRVLTSELVAGIPIDKVALLDQDIRNYVGKRLLELTLLELFVFRFMQTDPNWGNFLFDEARKTLNLIDFGAARDYPKSFVDNYLRMVVACATGDRNGVIEMSCRLGFLSGEETDIMLDAHVQAGFVVGLPFSKAGGFDFRSSNITQSLTNLGATMLKHRLTPPPDEAYSLHRKLSGAFLACIKLGAVVPCRELLFQVYDNHQFSEANE